MSPRTLVGYEHDLKLWVKYAGDVDVSAVTTPEIRAYLAWLRAEYKPRRFGGGEQPLSPKTVRNSWVTLSAFFAWAAIEFNVPDPMQGVPPPQYKEPPVDPFTKEQVEALLKVAEYCREANTTDRRRFTMRRATGRRDRAIILTLLDTGLRASELCALKISDVDQKTGKVEVKHGVRGGGKGRTVYLGQGTRRALWRYLAERDDGEDPNAPLFVGKFNRPLNSNSLRHVIIELGKKAQIGKCHPHKFRHTFAITYLRSGGDVFTLQALLGHGSLDMVQHYARIAEMDIQPGETLIGRPLGMSCGCPITHCGVAMQVDHRTGVIVWCVTGPLRPRQQGKDLGYYIAEGYEGLIQKTRCDIKIGMRYFFQPHMCMLQWRHSGLVNYLNRTPNGLQVRVEGLWIG